MSGAPRLPIHTGDYLKDTPPVSRAKWEHHGIYLLLLIQAWNTPGCRLPAKEGWLADRMGCDLAEYREFVLPVLQRYFTKRRSWWYQKRLTKEALYVSNKSEKQAENAKSRWNKEKPDANALPKKSHGNAPTPTPTPTPQVVVPATFEQNLRKADRLGAALGIDLTTTTGGPKFISEMVQMEMAGFDFELDILAAITERRDNGGFPAIKSLTYFQKPIEAKREQRLLAAQMVEARANTPVEPADANGWARRLEQWLDCGYWPPKYGPRPRSGECAAPAGLLVSAWAEWKAQGEHPRGAFPADPNGRWWPWKSLRDLRNDPDCDYGVGLTNVFTLPRRVG